MANTTHRKPQSHIINILQNTRQHHPNFALFLGAGASVTSGVKTTRDMIAEWRVASWKMYGQSQALDPYCEKQSWYKKSDEYSILFEALYDQPSQRREYIESCLTNANPSWGYIYLVNLIGSNVFNTVFTTNFDDILNDACYLFSNAVRPIVCAHDSSIRSVRITSKRPKIVKLHGDFLFDNIKNTVGELESLEHNMREKFKQYATEFGLIVVGYAGNDRSVMDALNALLRNESSFPNGIYWCVQPGVEISPNVEALTKYPQFKLVEILGFDQFFAEIQDALEIPLQPEMSDPYRALAQRLNKLIQDVNLRDSTKSHPRIERDIRAIGKRIESQSLPQIDLDSSDLTVKLGDQIIKLPLPFELLSEIEKRQGHAEKALKYRMKQLDASPEAASFVEAFTLMAENQLFKYEDQLIRLLKKAGEVLLIDPNQTFAMSLPLISAKRFEVADEILNLGHTAYLRGQYPLYDKELFLLNKLQIKLHKGELLTTDESNMLRQVDAAFPNTAKQMGARILLREYKAAEDILLDLFKRHQLKLPDVWKWPIFRLLEDHVQNPELKRLISAPAQLEDKTTTPRADSPPRDSV